MWELKFYRGKWYAYKKSGGKSIRRSLRTADKSLADARLKDFINSQIRPNESMEDVFNHYMEKKNDKNLEYRWKVLKPHFVNILPDCVTEDDCKRYVAKSLSDGKKLGAIITELSLLRAAIRLNNKATTSIFYIPPAPPPRDVYLNKAEAMRLIDAAHAPHLKLFITMALMTAARKSAILRLKWQNVNLERGLIDFGGGNKNKRNAITPINNTLEEALEDAYKGRTTDYVIEHGGKPVKDVKTGWIRTRKLAGFPNLRIHDLRHLSARWMAEEGVPMSEISQYLGHENSLVTERVYARFSPMYLKKAAGALEIKGSIEPQVTS